MSVSAKSDARIPWLIVAAGCLIALMTFGPRSAMGFFQLPMLADRGWDRATFGMAMAIQNLFWGLGQPFFGAIADRFGTWRVLAMSGVLYASGLALMAQQSACSRAPDPITKTRMGQPLVPSPRRVA